MNWQHLQAFVWLRWRCWSTSGAAPALQRRADDDRDLRSLVTAIPLFIGCFMLGLYAIPKAAPVHLMYAWDGVIVAFLFFWGIGLVTELQRPSRCHCRSSCTCPSRSTGRF